MKTSNILIIAAIIVLLGMTTAYNFSLKAAYRTGSYKDPFRGGEFQEMKNIEILNINAANIMSVVVEPGQKEGVWVKREIKDRIVLNQVGSALTISLVDEDRNENGNFGGQDIIVVTNSLSKLKTTAFWANEKKENDGNAYYWAEVNLKMITGTNLELQIADYTSVTMNKVNLKTLKAVVGTVSGGAGLNLDPDNQIEFADFEIPGAGKLSLNNPKIVKTRYSLSDKATVTLNGAALQEIKN